MKSPLRLFSLIFLFIHSFMLAQNNKSASIETYMKRAHEIGVFNGNVFIIDHDQVVYKASLGFSDVTGKIPLTEKSIFQIGSIAKEFNAVGIMLLKEQGKLRLDQKVSDFFPDLPAWAKKITIKNLLQYTSGLPDVNWYTIKSEADNWKDLYALSELKFEPGTNYFYNNNNTFLQRKIIEKVAEMPFNDFVQQKLLKPVGIQNAIVDPTGNEPFVTESFDENFKKDTIILHVTGWTSIDINDLYKWSQAIANFKIIPPSSTLEILTPFGPGKQAGLGKGTMKNNRVETHIHDGTAISSQGLLVNDNTKKRTLLFLTNQKHRNLYEINEALNNMMDGKPYLLPRKSILYTFKMQIDSMDAKTFLTFCKKLMSDHPNDYGFDNPLTFNEIGYYYLYNKKQVADAITIFEYNVALFPTSGTIMDSLAEGYLEQGNKQKALNCYKKSIALGYDENPDAVKIIQELEK